MFRSDFDHDTISVCFPRIRGDVPMFREVVWPMIGFSPHTRGCSSMMSCSTSLTTVFPAYAGMFRSVLRLLTQLSGFPRIRGDVPKTCTNQFLGSTFSPHTRGCSEVEHGILPSMIVFPAYAGMFRSQEGSGKYWWRFPRIRGDVPLLERGNAEAERFSPHTRGCSCAKMRHRMQPPVFPAYAGMFRRAKHQGHDEVGFPRIRGDVPHADDYGRAAWPFSPHTRGCSGFIAAVNPLHVVFPAYAGMFRRYRLLDRSRGRFPRIRGDVPAAATRKAVRDGFSPHTRGCSRGKACNEEDSSEII